MPAAVPPTEDPHRAAPPSAFWARLRWAFSVTVVAIVAIGLLLGRRWEVEVAATIDAPPAAIHAWIEDLRRWPSWSHWYAGADATLRHRFEGKERGVGARWAFDGERLGRGAVEIVTADPARGVELASTIGADVPNGRISLRYEPVVGAAGRTRVIWRDEGTLPWIIGGYYKGSVQAALREALPAALQRLRALAEASAQAR